MFKNWMKSLALGVMAIISLASCDRDQEVAINIAGEWHGDFGVYYTEIERDRYGQIHEYTYRASDSYLRFIPEYTYATYGRGTQVDYYDGGRYELGYYQFDWEVRNGSIYLTYIDCPELNVRIDRYRMDDLYFSGRIGNTNFSLRKIADYYDWTPFCHGHGYRNRAGYTRVTENDETTTVTIRHGNIMNEK